VVQPQIPLAEQPAVLHLAEEGLLPEGLMRPVRLDIEKIRDDAVSRSYGRPIDWEGLSLILQSQWRPLRILGCSLGEIHGPHLRVDCGDCLALAIGLQPAWTLEGDDTSDDFGGGSHQPGDIGRREE
jgi:hypothetical protein